MKSNTKNYTPLYRLTRVLLLTAMAVALLGLASAQRAQAFEFASAGGSATDIAGNPLAQAGAHPDLTTDFHMKLTAENLPEESVKNVRVELPAGVLANPSATPKCPQDAMRGAHNFSAFPECSPSTQVGFMEVYGVGPAPLFNVQPPAGVPARLSANFAGIVVNIDPSVRTGGDYGVTAVVRSSSQSLPVSGSKVTLWGVPSDPAHDFQRTCNVGFEMYGCPSPEPRAPFVSNASDCAAGPLRIEMAVESWQNPGVFARAGFDHDFEGNPLQVTGCEKVRFEPKLSVQPQSREADSPTGLDVSLAIPQNEDPDGIATALLNRATVVFPEGMAVNPSSADGLAGCSPAAIALASAAPPSCPDAAKIATVAIRTPLLEEEMEGAVYLARQTDNPFGSTLAVYLVAEGPGVVIKVPGRISPDPRTGRLTTSFASLPQLPFDELRMRFKGGPRAALLNPPACGDYVSSGRFVPWSALDKEQPNRDEVRTSTDSFRIASGPNGGPCPGGEFDPTLEAGTTTPVAGSYSPFLLRLRRDDGTQRLAGLSVNLPPGLLGKLAGIPYCGDAALAAIPAAVGTGAAQAASPSCPAASRVGTVSVGAGAGANPFYADTGRAYLAGPYKGAPLSLAVVVPAVAGPFDLGNVVVRNALVVDPVTARLSAVSDPIPTVLDGIPLDVRDVRVDVDRPQFMLNPTSCDPMRISGQATAASGARAQLGARFQVTNCAALGFKPKLAIELSGKTNRSSHPALKATLTMPQGGANVARAAVTLPKTEFLEQAHIKTICTRVQYAADKCPKASIYGYAKAWSPLLDKPLQGPVYLRSSSNKLPDLVASLDGQIQIDLAGRIDTKNARIRNTFDLVPDAPVSKFVLTMQGGKKGLLVNNTELCKAKPKADVRFEGQNGKAADSQPLVKVDCGKQRKGKK